MTVETSSNRSKAFPTFLNKTRYRNLRNLPYCVFKFAINTSGLSINYCCPSATLVESKKMSVHDLILNEPPVRPVSQKVAPNSTFFPGSLQHEEVTGARQWKWTGDPSAWRSRAPWTAPFSPFQPRSGGTSEPATLPGQIARAVSRTKTNLSLYLRFVGRWLLGNVTRDTVCNVLAF